MHIIYPPCTKPGGMGNNVHSLLPPKKNYCPQIPTPQGDGTPKVKHFSQAVYIYTESQKTAQL